MREELAAGSTPELVTGSSARVQSSTETVIRPPGAWPGLGLGELWRSRSICLVLARRSLKARYRQTFLGAAWTLLQPILLMTVFTIFFGLFARFPSQGLPFPVFYFLALLPWQIVARLMAEGGTSVAGNSALVSRVYFPRAYLPAATAISALVDFGFGLIALAILLVVFGIVPGPLVIIVPALVAIAVATGLGAAFVLSALHAAYRDIQHVLPALTQLWFFGSPILYPSDVLPEAIRPLYYINPMALVIDGFRSAFGGTAPPSAVAWAIGATVAALMLVGGYLFFRKREPTLADVV